MQQTLDRSWWQNARMPGIFRYHWKALGKVVLWVWAILLASQLVALIFPLLTRTSYPYSGTAADIGTTLFLSLVCSLFTANKSTRFFLRFGTPRFSVWLGNLLSLFIGMIVFLVGTLLMNTLVSLLVVSLGQSMPDKFHSIYYYAQNDIAGLFQQTLSASLASLPKYILYTVEWTCLFYLLACCMRRNRVLTLVVIIGVPTLLMILTLIPAVRQAVSAFESSNEQQMTLLGVQWMIYLRDFATFVEREWPTIQLIAAGVSLPLSYLCMRNTAQP